MGVVLEIFRMNIFPKNIEKHWYCNQKPGQKSENLSENWPPLKYGTLISKNSDSNKKKFKQSSITRYMYTDGKWKRKRDQRTHHANEREESEQGNNQRDTGKTQRNEPNGKIDLRDSDQRDTDQRDTDQCDKKTKRKKETKEAIAKERTGIG